MRVSKKNIRCRGWDKGEYSSRNSDWFIPLDVRTYTCDKTQFHQFYNIAKLQNRKATAIGKLFKIFGVRERNQHIWAFIWTNSNRKTQFWKHFIEPLLGSWPQVPQVSPKGPKFSVQNFSIIICKWCVFIGFFDLLTKNQSLFSEPSLTFPNIATY